MLATYERKLIIQVKSNVSISETNHWKQINRFRDSQKILLDYYAISLEHFFLLSSQLSVTVWKYKCTEIMFPSSTQSKHWIFQDKNALLCHHEKANTNFQKSCDQKCDYLTVAEELTLCRHFEFVMKEFCSKFQPPMPRNVIGTAFTYFKRFYLNNSVMAYHPKHIMLTCVYLACKVEEFNVTVMQYVANLPGKRGKAVDLVLNNELLLMEKLNYQLTVHHSWRPLEGFIIDLKTRSEVKQSDVENLRKGAEIFLDKCLLSDASLLYSPSQIALAALVYSAEEKSLSVSNYLNILMGANTNDSLKGKIKQIIGAVVQCVDSVEQPVREEIKVIEKRLDKCRNKDSDPDSSASKRRKERGLKADEHHKTAKYARRDNTDSIALAEGTGK